jgi:hypothetical protein
MGPMRRDHGYGRAHQPALPLDEPSPPGRAPAVDWRLDEHTRLVGRAGVAAARAALTSSANGMPSPRAAAATATAAATAAADGPTGATGATSAEDQAA